MAKITIEVPDDYDYSEIYDYVVHVAGQIEDCYTSGYSFTNLRWDME